MALTIEQIKATKDDKELFDLLSAELQRLLPEEVQENPTGTIGLWGHCRRDCGSWRAFTSST